MLSAEIFTQLNIRRYSPNGYVANAAGVQETKLNIYTIHCSAKLKSRSRSVTADVSGQGAPWHMCMKLHTTMRPKPPLESDP